MFSVLAFVSPLSLPINFSCISLPVYHILVNRTLIARVIPRSLLVHLLVIPGVTSALRPLVFPGVSSFLLLVSVMLQLVFPV